MDDLEKLNETLLYENEYFHSHLNMKDITDANYSGTKRVHEDFKIKKLGKYRDFYLQSDTLLLPDVFENLNMCLEIYELNPTCFLTAPGLAWQRALKRAQVNLGPITDINMLFMVEKGNRGGICHAIH